MASETLPPDMIFEILSRTSSLETMKRCEAASKCLKQIIYEPNFLFFHCKRSNCVFGYFFQTTINHRYQSTLVSNDEGGAVAGINRTWRRGRGPPADINGLCLRDDIRILASCDQGILCCERQTSHRRLKHRYYVCKPATNQWQLLPDPQLCNETVVVTVVVVKSHPLRYIIVRLSAYEINYNCEILDSENGAWEKIEGPILAFCDLIDPHNPAVTAGQCIHWLTTEDNVLTLDVNKRKRRFRRFPLPEAVHYMICKKLVKYGGGLGLTCLTRDWMTMELWVVETLQGRGVYWRRKMMVDIKFLGETLRNPKLVDFCNTDVVFMTTDDGAVFYNLQDRTFTKVKVPYDNIRHSIQFFRFRSDFEMVHLDQTPD
ncbi:hypothetical protein C2S53_001312 [Perilla frutescens var. hirtella]|uniref:F-box protein At3g26010-like beta-propeller domain-containing protein n=1 Tax=Perilla frutescens var. hirtella TaxID=608512 RepID=A0AAD4P8C4_PERFH|nr:hypothetical protein C2S53_001312 [Perilla frutescens var. hirtella]